QRDFGQLRALVRRNLPYHVRRRLPLRRHYRGAARDDDACLLARYLGHRVAEDLAVLEADVSDHGDVLLLKDVGRIEEAAEAYFNHLRLHLMVTKHDEG